MPDQSDTENFMKPLCQKVKKVPEIAKIPVTAFINGAPSQITISVGYPKKDNPIEFQMKALSEKQITIPDEVEKSLHELVEISHKYHISVAELIRQSKQAEEEQKRKSQPSALAEEREDLKNNLKKKGIITETQAISADTTPTEDTTADTTPTEDTPADTTPTEDTSTKDAQDTP
ncbi:hypothetical protein Fsol_00131 [Candidatus Fokinia solitaria]|uniref:Uncharacterized protein n=1 Tax=Candidatus Fokinia solitaria TaxID=1802984 RepID=A0A2U8BRI0_9RICK|nr:DUF2610 domain-containing protein [Candidatus Fokinia solitaria]AWD32939.1 hypothetical protein Fsol_00131 [Candidatus Fokinia solitaria]